MTKHCLRLSANESYQGAEEELEALIGVKVSHSTCQRIVQRTAYEQPTAKQKVTQIRVDLSLIHI